MQLRGSAVPGIGKPIAAGAGAEGTEFCRLARQQADDVTNAQDGDGDTAGLVQRVRERSGRMLETAPAEIRGDVETLHRASEAFFAGGSGADMFTLLRSPEVRTAGLRVAEYLQSTCKVAIPTGLPTGG